MAFPNDPRLAARKQQQQQSSVIEHGASRKRSASKSPQTDDRPVQKLARTVLSAGRQQATSSLDLAQSGSITSASGSRGPSLQANGGKPAPRAAPRAAPSPAVPLAANMNTGVQVSKGLNSKQNETLSALMNANSFAAELASTRVFHGQAKAKKDKADREFAALQNRFAAFPSMKEQHTNAKKLAADQFKMWDGKLKRQEHAQQSTMINLVKLLIPSAAVDVAPDVGYATQRDLTKFAPDRSDGAATLRDRLADLEKRVDVRLSNAPAAVPDAILEARIGVLEKAVEAVEGKLSKEQDTTIVTRIDALHQTVAAVEAKQTQQADTGLAERVDALESVIGVVDRKTDHQRGIGLLSHIDTLDETIKSIEENQAQQHDVIELYVDEQLNANRKSFSDEVDRVRDSHESLEREVGELRTIFDAGKKIQHQNAQAIDECASRLEHIEEQRHSTHADLEKIEKNVAGLAAAPGTAPLQHSTNTDGLFIFRPIAPGNPEEEDLPRLQRLENDIQALQAISGHHKQRLDNTTTDHLLSAVADRVFHQIAAAKDLQSAFQGINATIGILNDQVGAVNANIGALSDRIQSLENSTDNQDVGNIRTEVEGLSSQVAKYENIVEVGTKEIAQINDDIKAIKRDVVRLDIAFDKVLETVPQRVDE